MKSWLREWIQFLKMEHEFMNMGVNSNSKDGTWNHDHGSEFNFSWWNMKSWLWEWIQFLKMEHEFMIMGVNSNSKDGTWNHDHGSEFNF